MVAADPPTSAGNGSAFGRGLRSRRRQAESLAHQLEIKRARASRLAEIGHALASITGRDPVLDVIHSRAAGVLDADAVAVGFVEGDAIRPAPGGPATSPLGMAPDGVPIAADLPPSEAVRSRDVVFVEDLEQYAGGTSALRQQSLEAGFTATAAVPLHEPDGDVFGVIVFAWSERPSLASLEPTLRTLGELCSQTLARAEREALETDRARALAQLSSSLAAATTTEAVTAALMADSRQPLHACYVNFVLLDERARQVVVQAPSTLEPDVAQRYARIDESAEVPISAAVRDNAVVLIADLDDYQHRFPGAANDARRVGFQASAAVPLRRGARVVGAIGFAWDRPVHFDDTIVATMRTIADLASQTLERARLWDAEHEMIASLHHHVLRQLPDVEDLEIAARYRPASRVVSIGGDWYDAIDVGDGSVVFVIGDVVGHGVSAVASMIEIQATLRGLIRAAERLGDIVLRAEQMLGNERRILATCALFRIDALRRSIEYLNAGHPPAILRLPDGTTRVLDEARHRPLGLFERPIATGVQPFPDGATLLAYTDGLVERRGEDIADGIGRMAERFGKLPAEQPLDKQLSALLSASNEGTEPSTAIDDDVAMIAVRHSAAAAGAEPV